MRTYTPVHTQELVMQNAKPKIVIHRVGAAKVRCYTELNGLLEIIEFGNLGWNYHNVRNPKQELYELYERDDHGYWRCKYPAFGMRAPTPTYLNEVRTALFDMLKKEDQIAHPEQWGENIEVDTSPEYIAQQVEMRAKHLAHIVEKYRGKKLKIDPRSPQWAQDAEREAHAAANALPESALPKRPVATLRKKARV